MQQVMFAILSLVTLGSGLMVVTERSLFRAALWLVLTFFGIAGLFILLQAEFLAVTQVLIYVGAISTLIIFAIMLSRGVMNPKAPAFNSQPLVVGAIALLLAVLLIGVVLNVPWPVVAGEPPANAIERLGIDFVGSYVIPFEVASVLLVAAMIGAIIIAREREQ
jgi:NADH:ubiquinone oxidoreductase subunit 6 (subunit J)